MDGEFDPGQFGDPVATETSWEPSAKDGASFKTHDLVEANAQRMEFRLTGLAKVFLFAFPAFGFVGLAVSIPIGMALAWWAGLIAAAAGALFVGSGAYIKRTLGRSVAFDRAAGTLSGVMPIGERKASAVDVDLDSVHALQLLTKHVQGKGPDASDYLTHELIAVKDDGERVLVVSHGDRDALKRDAETIGRFLVAPVWDATW